MSVLPRTHTRIITPAPTYTLHWHTRKQGTHVQCSPVPGLLQAAGLWLQDCLPTHMEPPLANSPVRGTQPTRTAWCGHDRRKCVMAFRFAFIAALSRSVVVQTSSTACSTKGSGCTSSSTTRRWAMDDGPACSWCFCQTSRVACPRSISCHPHWSSLVSIRLKFPLAPLASTECDVEALELNQKSFCLKRISVRLRHPPPPTLTRKNVG